MVRFVCVRCFGIRKLVGPFRPYCWRTEAGAGSSMIQFDAAGREFARRGYVALFLFRRAQGLSADQGSNISELLARREADSGSAAFNRLQLQLLETDQLEDCLAGLRVLRLLPQVDPRRIGFVGHSFGGSLALLVAERDRGLRAVVDFAGAARSWDRSPGLRARLITAVRRGTVPLFFIHAANDYSVAPAQVLDAEAQRAGRPHRMKIYPPLGHSAAEGHNFIYRGMSAWKRDVFAFLGAYM